MGTFAEIREASKYADGRWDVLAVGTARFLVREVHTEIAPYLVADVDPYPDEPGDVGDDEAEELVERVTRRFVDYLRLLQPRDGETAEPIDVQMEVETEEIPDDDVDVDADDDDVRRRRPTRIRRPLAPTMPTARDGRPRRSPWTTRMPSAWPSGSRRTRRRCRSC